MTSFYYNHDEVITFYVYIRRTCVVNKAWTRKEYTQNPASDVQNPAGTTPSCSPKTPTQKEYGTAHRDVAGKRPRTTTPELTTTQRELKKLKDYWTTNNPVPDDSPRLRSARKTNFDLKHITREIRRPAKSRLDNYSNNSVDKLESLSESPLPEVAKLPVRASEQHISEKDIDLTSTIEHPKTLQVTKVRTRNLNDTPKPSCSVDEQDYSSPVSTNHISSVQNILQDEDQEEKTNHISSIQNILQDKDQEEKTTSEHAKKTLQITKDALDHQHFDSIEDNDYVPPRKKLRSEVTKDELWEGFPLAVTFKRLAPISKQVGANVKVTEPTDEKGAEKLEEQHIETVKITSSSAQSSSSEARVDISLSSNDNDGEARSTEQKILYEMKMGKNDILAGEQRMRTTQEGKPVAARIRKVSSPSIIKRSARLLEKSGQTPEKPRTDDIKDKSKNTPPTLTKLVESKLQNDNALTKTSAVITMKGENEKVEKTSQIFSKGKFEGSLKDMAIADIEDKLLTGTAILDTEKASTRADVIPSQHQSSTSQKDRTVTDKYIKPQRVLKNSTEVAPTVSEILSFDDNVNKPGTSDTSHGEREYERTINEVKFSVSSTLHDMFGDLAKGTADDDYNTVQKDTPFTALKNMLEEGSSCHEEAMQKTADSKMDVPTLRRSRRLSNLDVSRSLQEIQEDSYTKIGTGKSLALSVETDAPKKSLESYSAKYDMPSTSHDTEVLFPPDTDFVPNPEIMPIKKTGLFSSKKKHSKVVPPLRIRLKPPKKDQKKANLNSKSTELSSSGGNIDAKSRMSTVPQTKEHDEQVVNETVNVNDVFQKKKKTDIVESTAVKKKPKKKQRVRSPPPADCIALRLNNERRLSAAGSLLSNPLLNKHACVLWSSENRRHVHLSHPKASPSELDNILSKRWDRLSDKEKLRYFQRARDALRDENRHSKRRHVLQAENTFLEPKASSGSIESFMKLGPASQMTEIKRWLNMYHEISPELCSGVIDSFKGFLVKENEQKLKEKTEKTKLKARKIKQKKDGAQTESSDNNALYRKTLFLKILENKENMLELVAKKRKVQHQSMVENYNLLIHRLVSGDEVSFGPDVWSDRLTEILLDIRALEKDSKLAVKGDDSIEAIEIRDIVDRLGLQQSPDGRSLVRALDCASIDCFNIESRCKQILEFPSLSPRSLAVSLQDLTTNETERQENIFNELSSTLSEHAGLTADRKSPATVLTDWVAEDLVTAHPQIGFRKAISLLSNKVVPSPTLIMPKNTPDGNRNQNCNVMFTKLQRCVNSKILS